MQTLIEKYRPKNLSQMVGQESALRELKNFINSFSKQKKRAVILYGASGTGKTAGVYALANELDLEVVEVNASDFRNQEQINNKIGNALMQKSLFKKGKIILIDEVDGISGNDDRGGLQTIIRLIENALYPILLTINDTSDNKFSTLRSKCRMIKFEKISYEDVVLLLKKICKKENISIDSLAISSIARKSGGNLMCAINDLQSIINTKSMINKSDIENVAYRDSEETMQSALIRIFKTLQIRISLTAFDNVKEDISAQFLWIDENIPNEYTNPSDLANAYDSLSKADIFNRRIKRTQYYRFMVYINTLLTAGVSLSKKEKYENQIDYIPTKRLLKIFWANQRSLKKKEIALRIAEKTHCSFKSALKDIYYYKIIFRNKKMAKDIAHELGLNDVYIEWMVK